MPAAKSKRLLKPLHPELGIVGALEWLTDSFQLPVGYSVAHVVRHGRQRIDPLTIHITSGNGQPDWTVRFAEQRDTMRPGSLRNTLSSETDGKIRMPYVSEVEASDVFAALCLAASTASAQDARDETQDWADQVVDNAEPVHGYTLQKDGRYDALMMLVARGVFDVRRAKALLAGTLSPEQRQVLLVDKVTGWRYLRASEVATYIRLLIGPAPMAQPTLDARLAEIGIDRVRYEERRGRRHPAVVFYVLPDAETDGGLAG